MSPIKILSASRAPYINQYKNTAGKILNCNGNIYFNQECIKRNIISQYAKIKSPLYLSGYKIYRNKIIKKIGIKDEIKFLYTHTHTHIYIYNKNLIRNFMLRRRRNRTDINLGVVGCLYVSVSFFMYHNGLSVIDKLTYLLTYSTVQSPS